MNKKLYIAPRMDVVEMKTSVALLQGSGEDGPNIILYSDEFGLNYTSETENKG